MNNINNFRTPIELINNNKNLDKNIIDNLQLFDNEFNEYYNNLININNYDDDNNIIDNSNIIPKYNFDLSNNNYLYNHIFNLIIFCKIIM